MSDAHIAQVEVGGQVRVPYQEVLTLAGLVEDAGHHAFHGATRAAATAISPHLAFSMPFSPTTGAAAEAALTALGGALTAWSGALVGDARSVRVAARCLAQADEAQHAALHVVERGIAAFVGREWVTPNVRPTDLQVPASTTPPTDLTSLVDHLGQVNDLSDGDHPENKGTIEVQTITSADGTRRFIVYMPGLDDMRASSMDEDVRDVGAAASLEAGVPTAYGAGVLQALHDAGARPGDDVTLVGHSEGGMQAAALAVHGTPYHITHVVTAGSPGVPGHVPSGVHLLSLEHRGDPVPLTDLGAQDHSATHVNVTFDHQRDLNPLGNHAIKHYVAGAEAAQHSDDPVLQHAVSDLWTVLGQPGDQATSTVFQITRGDPVPVTSPAWIAQVMTNPGGTLMDQLD